MNGQYAKRYTGLTLMTLLLTLLLLPSMVSQPSGSLSVWLSIIPLRRPISILYEKCARIFRKKAPAPAG